MLFSQFDHLVFEIDEQLLLANGSLQFCHLLLQGKDLLGVAEVFHDQSFWFCRVLAEFGNPSINRCVTALVGPAKFGNRDQTNLQFLDFGLPEPFTEVSTPALLEGKGNLLCGAHMLGFE